MTQVDERIAHLEGIVTGHTQALLDLRVGMARLEERMDRGFSHVDARFVQVDARFAVIEGRLSALDQKIDQKIDAIGQRLDRNFHWVIGIQVTVLVAVVAAILAK